MGLVDGEKVTDERMAMWRIPCLHAVCRAVIYNSYTVCYCELVAGEVTRTKKRKSLTEGVTFRRVRRLEIHCKVRVSEDVMLL